MPRPWKQVTVDDAASELASLLTLSNETTTRKVANAFLTGHMHQRPLARGPQPRQGSPPAPSPKGGYITPARQASASPSRVRVNIIRGGGLPSSTKKPAPVSRRSPSRRSAVSSVTPSPMPLPLATASPPPSAPPNLDETRTGSDDSTAVVTAPPRSPTATNRASEPFGEATPAAAAAPSAAQVPSASPTTEPESANAAEHPTDALSLAGPSSSGPSVPLGGVLAADPTAETVEASATSSHLSSPDGSATAQRLVLDPSSPFRADGSPHELVVPEVRFAVHTGAQTDLDAAHVAALERKVDAQAARIRELEQHLAELTAGLEDDEDVDEEEMQRRLDAQLAEIDADEGRA